MTCELGILGGSFDPPHVGHLMLACYALATSPMKRLLVVPTFQHALNKPLTDFEHRIHMCELAFADLRRVEVSSLERELGGVSRTLRLVQSLKQRYPDTNLRLIVGADILLQAHLWQAFDEICELAPLFVVGRAGYAPPHASDDAPLLPQVSSTHIREALRTQGDATRWVPTQVLSYIHAHGLYQAAESS